MLARLPLALGRKAASARNPVNWLYAHPVAQTCRRNLSNEQESSSLPDDFGLFNIILPEEPFVFGVAHITPRTVPQSILRPSYVSSKLGNASSDIFQAGEGTAESGGRIELGGEDERRLRAAAKLAKEVRKFASTLIKVGVTTNYIDTRVHEYIISRGAYPSPLLYRGFPKSCCTSVNNVIVHGIPDDRPLEDGDIINVDITVYLNGYHGDTSSTWLVGNVDDQGQTLCSITNEALQTGIAACGPGRPFKGIGKAIHELLKQPVNGMHFCVSQQFSGHGIGKVFHREPWILHHLNDEPGVMLPGDCFTIEPAVIQGVDSHGWIFPDGWTASTENCARAAQAEHMVLITESGADVLTE